MALTIPAVTLPPKPNGLPTANIQSPTSSLSESPILTKGNGVDEFLKESIQGDRFVKVYNYSVKELKYILNLLTEANKTDPLTPFSEEKFIKIANKALNLILDDISLKRKLKNKLKSIIK